MVGCAVFMTSAAGSGCRDWREGQPKVGAEQGHSAQQYDCHRFQSECLHDRYCNAIELLGNSRR